MKLSTACSSTGGLFSDGSPLSQGRRFLNLMLVASPGVSAERSEFWPGTEEDSRDAAPTDLLRFLADGCEETFELGSGRACNARTCSITFSVSCRKTIEASSRYPSQTSLRLMHRRHEGRASSHRTPRCLQRRHPRLRRTIGIKLALVPRSLLCKISFGSRWSSVC
jgi:hypothetical protein